MDEPKGFSINAVDDYGKEALAKAAKLNADAEWFLAVDDTGESDVDIAYSIPESIKDGKLGEAIEQLRPDAGKLLVLMYDLGTSEEETHLGLKFSELRQTLENWYAMGAPNGTVYHEFLILT
ncbi:MAG: hypothetical protein EYR95_18130 [Phormidium sp. SL48-SHIP]|nr:MAG: hypothetical protein EYR95_18130 [Phormidium sp. SL48-SHIP]